MNGQCIKPCFFFHWLDTGSSIVGQKTDKHGACQVGSDTLGCFLFVSRCGVWCNSSFRAAGITFQLHVGGMSGHTPTLLSCSALPAGGSRPSGWALVLLAVVLLALVLFAGLWVLGLSFVSLCARAPTRGRVFFRRYLDRCSGTLAPCIRSIASRRAHLVEGVVMDQSDGGRSPVPRGDNTGEAEFVSPSSANHRLSGPADRFQNFLMHLGRCTRWQVVYDQTGSLRDGWIQNCQTGATLRRQSLRAVAAAVFFCPCRCGDFGFVTDVPATPDVEASCVTSCRGRRVSFCRPHSLSATLCSIVLLERVPRRHCQVVSPVSKLSFKVAVPPSCCRGNFHSFFMTLFTGRGRHHSSFGFNPFGASLFGPHRSSERHRPSSRLSATSPQHR